MGIPLPDGGWVVVYSDSHPVNRVRATLMEEFFHIRLDHPRTTLRVYGESGAYRDYDPEVEGQAYGSGAAALVPFRALREMTRAGETAGRIARLLEVSRDLVVFRAKVTKLYARLHVR